MATRASKAKDVESGSVLQLGKDLGLTQYRDTGYSKVTDRLPTGIPQLDKILGGGLPFGRFNEVYGMNASGKSTFALQLIRMMQSIEGITILIDAEGTADPERARELGVSIGVNPAEERIFLIEPERDKKTGLPKEPLTVEFVGNKLLDILPKFAIAKTPILLIWDSIAQTPSINELEKGLESKQPGVKSKALTAFSNQIAPLINQTNVCMIGINQARDEMGSMWGAKESPGGHALHHLATVRLEVIKASALKEDDDDAFGGKEKTYVGHIVRFHTKKSKVSTPGKKVQAYLMALHGLDFEENIVRSAVVTNKQYNIINTVGNSYQYVNEDGEEVFKMAKSKVVPYLKENFEVAKEIFQRELLISFPHWYSPLDNENLDIEKIPYYSGLREKYALRKKEQEHAEDTGDTSSVND